MEQSDSPARHNSHRRRLKQLIKPVLAAFFTLFLFEAAARVLVFVGHPSRAKAPEFERKMAVAADPLMTGRPLILLGGSYIEHSIFPEALRRRFSQQGIAVHPKNLGCRKSCLLEQLVMLDTALGACKVSPIVFLDLRSEAFNKQFIADNKLNESAEFANSYIGHKYAPKKNWQDRLLLFFEDNFCLVRDRAFLRDQIVRLPTTVFSFERSYQSFFRRSFDFAITETSSFGSTADYGVQDDQVFLERTKVQEKRFAWNDQISRDWSLEWFEPIKCRCQRCNAPLVLLWLPEYTADLDVQTRNDYLKQKFATLADNKNVFFIDMHKIDSDLGHFRDRRHLNIEGAIAATDWLANRLMKPDLAALIQSGSAPPESKKTY